jgi:DNA-binding Lrp family transcriptional regulator
MHAFVSLQTNPARVDDVVIQLSGINGVRRAVSVTGTWDILAAVEGADLASIAGVVKRDVLSIDGVQRSSTAPVVPLDLIGIHGGGWATPGLPMTHPGPACYVQINAHTGTVASLVEALGELEDVSGIAVVAGEYDLLVELSEPWETASRVILEIIHALPGVERTTTAIGAPTGADDVDR